MEAEWVLDRMRLFQLRRDHPEWSQSRLAEALHRSLSWVKKWLKRFREAEELSLEMFKSQSRAPHNRPREVIDVVHDVILSLRDGLKDLYGRVVGPKTILYHLHQDQVLKRRGAYLPKSTRTIWKVLREGGRIPTKVREHHPLERPDPMQHWEMDFGELKDGYEFLVVVDRGTSILIDTQTQKHFNAETALMALAKLFVQAGLPQKLRFDNDSRFVGGWLNDRYPSALMRFLWCISVEPDLVEPGKPYHKPFVERSIRTLKHEKLWVDQPKDWRAAAEVLDEFRYFYNHERANQSSACGNMPPYEAFPELPVLRSLPETVDPDAWLQHYDRHIFKRRVAKNGTIVVGRTVYYVDYKYAGKAVGVLLDAKLRILRVLHKGNVLREVDIEGLIGKTMPFQDYLTYMLQEARTPSNDKK